LLFFLSEDQLCEGNYRGKEGKMVDEGVNQLGGTSRVEDRVENRINYGVVAAIGR